MPATSTTTRLPILFLAAAVLVAEALAAVGFAVTEVMGVEPSGLFVGASVAVLMLGYGVLLVLLARGVAGGRRWARGPTVATQLLQVLVALSFSAAPTRWLAWALAGTALVALVCVLSPRATAVFAPGDDASPR